MSIKMIRQNDIEKLSEKEQFEFYKTHFQGQHCELNGCGNEVSNNWGFYEGELYCESCFDWNIENEKEKAQKQFDYHRQQMTELKEKFNLE